MSQSTALVTGASSGMGKAIAKQLLNDGLNVYVAARRLESMQDLADKGARLIKLDLSKASSIEQAVNAILSQQTHIDVLVNNAGHSVYGAVEDMPLSTARYLFEVNLFGLAHLSQLLLPSMRRHGGAKIINISSMGGAIYTPLGAWYHASKHALEAWSDCLRLELAEFGVKVVIVQPGIINTGLAHTLIESIMQISGSGDYQALARRVQQQTQQVYQAHRSSPPQLVAKTVANIIKSKRVKHRYAVGKYAHLLIRLHQHLPTRWFDKLMLPSSK
ncbi:MAG: oxidoreductase [Gammaproteobacteria bacterium]|nr:oxidoreductase [Gammaproteobacteria bacterium]MDH5727688.1 oxidoreductase [Gammaproteobacteria bacterium]